jgi:hypothetical protein
MTLLAVPKWEYWNIAGAEARLVSKGLSGTTEVVPFPSVLRTERSSSLSFWQPAGGEIHDNLESLKAAEFDLRWFRGEGVGRIWVWKM